MGLALAKQGPEATLTPIKRSNNHWNQRECAWSNQP